MITIAVTPEERDLIIAALDSHQYWQLADDCDRRDGYVYGASAEASEHMACDRLAERLQSAAKEGEE